MTIQTRQLLRALALAAWVLAIARASMAEPGSAERALSDARFQEAKELMAKGQTAAACRKFAESQRLLPRGGTLLNLAACHKAEGKLAAAWSEFTQAATQARREGRQDRVQAATEEIAKIEPQLAWLKVEVDPSLAKESNVEITSNGERVPRSLWGTEFPVEPGTYEIVAKAPRRKPWTASASIGAPGEHQSITIADWPSVRSGGPEHTRDHAAPPSGKPAGRGQRTAAWIVGGVGLASVAVGGVFGVLALKSKQDSEPDCPDGRCNQTGYDAYTTADRNATIANVTIGAGLALVGAGAVLYATAPTGEGAARAPRRSQPRVTAQPSARGLVLGFGSVW